MRCVDSRTAIGYGHVQNYRKASRRDSYLFVFFFTALDLGKVMVETEVDRNVLELLFMSGCINFLSYGVLFPMILPTYLPNYFKENFRFTLST